VFIAVRPESASKPLVKEFEVKGATVRLVDVEKATAEQLAEVFKGMDTVISTLIVFPFTRQNVIVDASKLAGVKRLVPSEWVMNYQKGSTSLGDQVRVASLFKCEADQLTTQL
jgi:hypothetical protein